MAAPDSPPVPELAPDFVVVDVETACARVGSICQIGIVGFRDGRETFAWETLIDPREAFSSFNIGIHGITPARVLGAPHFAQVHPDIAGHLGGRVTVAHSSFDKTALADACNSAALPVIETRWLDSVRVAKRAWPQLSSHRLNVLAGFLGLSHRHHDALSDARVAGQVIVHAIAHTGMGIEGWLESAGRKRAAAPEAASEGPLAGQRIAVLGEAIDGPLARWAAAAGARIVASVGRTTTMLLVATRHPYGRWVEASAPWRKAEELRAAGKPIAIVTEADLRARIAA